MESERTTPNSGWTHLPQAARWLGLAGLIPFFAGAIIILWPDGNVPLGKILQAMLVYGVAILSFLGGVAWGAAMNRGEEAWSVYLLAVAPSLVAWGTLLFVFPLHQAFVMALAFALLWLVDRHHTAVGRFPATYLTLRSVLTVGVVVSFLVAGFVLLPA